VPPPAPFERKKSQRTARHKPQVAREPRMARENPAARFDRSAWPFAAPNCRHQFRFVERCCAIEIVTGLKREARGNDSKLLVRFRRRHCYDSELFGSLPIDIFSILRLLQLDSHSTAAPLKQIKAAAGARP